MKSISIETMLNRVENFHNAYGIPQRVDFGNIATEQYLLRVNLMAEENKEYLDACIDNDPIAIADALTDMLYILLGTMAVHGFNEYAKACFLEVHKSNMSKLDENGKPIYREDGKVLKGINYKAPNLQKVITKTQLNLSKK